MTRRLYVSDVHLVPAESSPSPEEARLRAFSTLLKAAVPANIDEVYVLGDLCEMWIGDDDDSPLAEALADLFAALRSQVDIKFIAGNRDFLLGENFARRTSIEVLNDPHSLPDGTLLSHGDNLCIDDAPYQQMRAVLRSKAWQQDILSKSLDERRAFGANLRAQSKSANANKAGNIMDVNASAVTELLDAHGAQRLIHGHTHRPAMHRLANGRERIVLGAWEHCGWWAVHTKDALTLRCAGVTWLGNQRPETLAASGALL